MDPTTRFSNKVENYIKYRPDYPQAMLDFFAAEGIFANGNIVADIGSGTGKLTVQMTPLVEKIYGVEPNEPMRQAAEDLLNEEIGFVSMDGTAENTNLTDNSVDVITAAQAFHWFKGEETAKEFKRILKRGGNVLLIWNERLMNTPFLDKYEQLIIRHATDYKQIDHRNFKDDVLRDFFAPNEMKKEVFDHPQYHDLEGLKGRLLSSSYIPGKEGPTYTQMIEELEDLFNKYQSSGQITINYKTSVFWGHFDQ